MEDVYGGVIKMLDTGDKLKVDQSHLETVIPAIGTEILLALIDTLNFFSIIIYVW